MRENRGLFVSAHASVQFALACLEPVGEHLRATSSFVTPEGEVMHWHDFGDLEGPGWAANAVGGAHLIYRWGTYLNDVAFQHQALRLADHVLDDGFVRDDGFIWPYWDKAIAQFCLNYAHTNDWLCPGSLAKIGVQMLDLASVLGEPPRAAHLKDTAAHLADWLERHVPPLENGWVPRRITQRGEGYPRTPEGNLDPICDHSADGLWLLELWSLLGRHDQARWLGDAFVDGGGFWGSINHDTYDGHENVAYAVAFRVLRRLADPLNRPAWREFAYEVALPAMARFRMAENRHGVATKGLFWMEASALPHRSQLPRMNSGSVTRNVLKHVPSQRARTTNAPSVFVWDSGSA